MSEDDAPQIVRRGMGWVYENPSVGVRITFDRMFERKDELRAELHITDFEDGHLARRQLNLLGARTISDLSRDLRSLIPETKDIAWEHILSSAIESVVQKFRRREDLEEYVGRIESPKPVTWLIEDLLMRDVLNVWLGAAATGKSTLAAAACVYHALGRPFLGRRTERGTPLYLDYESTADDFQEKVHDVLAGEGVVLTPSIFRMRMRTPLPARAHELGEYIDRKHCSLIVVDSVAAAGGNIGDHGWEGVANHLEQALLALPPVTVLLLDHITGDELKSGIVAVKARGGVRKLEIARNQWTLLRDQGASKEGRHVIEWHHTKINRAGFRPNFTVEILHGDRRMGFRTMDAPPMQRRVIENDRSDVPF